MKKNYTIIGLTLLVFQGEISFSQTSLQFYAPDTIVYGSPIALGDIEIDGGYILNKTSHGITVDVVRVQDVDILGSGWDSYFCVDSQCWAAAVDSVQFTIQAYHYSGFLPHFGITATPDSQTILMKVKNVNVPTDVVYQRFYGVTKIGSGIHEPSANLTKVSIYPSPAVAGNDFNMRITNANSKTKEISLVIYNIYGSSVSTLSNMQEGNNTLNLDLAAGMYSYSLNSGDIIINAGKFSVIK